MYEHTCKIHIPIFLLDTITFIDFVAVYTKFTHVVFLFSFYCLVIEFAFNLPSYTVVEGGPQLQVCVDQVIGQSSRDTSVNIQCSGGTATG